MIEGTEGEKEKKTCRCNFTLHLIQSQRKMTMAKARTFER
jgi:hypothetical protein